MEVPGATELPSHAIMHKCTSSLVLTLNPSVQTRIIDTVEIPTRHYKTCFKESKSFTSSVRNFLFKLTETEDFLTSCWKCYDNVFCLAV